MERSGDVGNMDRAGKICSVYLVWRELIPGENAKRCFAGQLFSVRLLRMGKVCFTFVTHK